MRIALDCDPGNGVPGANTDDGLALALALTSPRLRLELVTTVTGNTRAPLGAAIARALLDTGGSRHIPVVVGAERPLRHDPAAARHRLDTRAAAHHLEHLWDGVQPLAPAQPLDGEPHRLQRGSTTHEDQEAAADAIVDLVRRFPGEITLVAVGPLTNVATAMLRHPALAEELAGLVVMGGAIDVPGYPVETNFGYDPDAADLVLSSGARITLVPMDVTTRTQLTHTDLDRLADATAPLMQTLVRTARPWVDFSAATRGTTGAWIHDALAVALLVDPSLVDTDGVQVGVEHSDRASPGTLRCHAAAAPGGTGEVQVVTHVDNARLVDLLLHTLATGHDLAADRHFKENPT